MGRKYGLGKYGAGTYDLEAVHPKIIFEGSFTIPVNFTPPAYTLSRRFIGVTIIKVDISGNMSHRPLFNGHLFIPVNFSVVDPFIGPFWSPTTDDNWCDVPDPWLPVVTPDIPCKVPLWPT